MGFIAIRSGPEVTPRFPSGAIVASFPDSAPGGSTLTDPDVADHTALDRPWVTVVWDDPVNLMQYVAFIFQKLFGYSKARAHELMMQVHTEGKAVVSSGDREKMEADVRRLHTAGLWATMQRDS
ncbi:ATP-dependent Clp protease adapter protein ClpS [Gordonia effusa NBRC 100432]|uniref:ATP-dependent Clp protease adapter protein ClpS n=1 Tax=Gordonia effusa NBRC 100432 TaxID=1077974 RepID=H0R6F4_9ACTN|nr:ATP-dependent Clp protease adapter ClpS [Gordonia effusa]GAB20655.1 ATP-dependent Clp protease adapter protein ClpS [Gordonia effusa NBRC 100432]